MPVAPHMKSQPESPRGHNENSKFLLDGSKINLFIESTDKFTNDGQSMLDIRLKPPNSERHKNIDMTRLPSHLSPA